MLRRERERERRACVCVCKEAEPLYYLRACVCRFTTSERVCVCVKRLSRGCVHTHTHTHTHIRRCTEATYTSYGCVCV